MRSGQTAKARGLYEERLKSDPDNLQMLETVANIYKAEGNQAGYVSTIAKIVDVDPKYKGYQLALAVEKEKAKDFKGALEQYGQWVSRNGGDINAVKSMHRLAEGQKDTAALMDALVRLNREKNVDNGYKFQLAELDYKRSGQRRGRGAGGQGPSRVEARQGHPGQGVHPPERQGQTPAAAGLPARGVQEQQGSCSSPWPNCTSCRRKPCSPTRPIMTCWWPIPRIGKSIPRSISIRRPTTPPT